MRIALFFLLLFCSCNNKDAAFKAQRYFLHAPIDTAVVHACEVRAEPKIFDSAFFDGTTVHIQDTLLARFFPVNVGLLDLPTGKVVASDAIMTYGAEPYKIQFPIGKFPVQLAIAKFADHHGENVAFSRIVFSNERVARWEFALMAGQDSIPLFGEKSYSYGVDAGVGGFMDFRSLQLTNQLSESSNKQLFDSLTSQLEFHSHSGWQSALIHFKGIDMAAFSSGYGDGGYSTYVGYDSAGKPCRLLTDFGLVSWYKK